MALVRAVEAAAFDGKDAGSCSVDAISHAGPRRAGRRGPWLGTHARRWKRSSRASVCAGAGCAASGTGGCVLMAAPGGRRKAIVLAIAGAAFAAGAFALKTESLGDPHGSQWVIFASLILIAASLHWAVLVAARKRFLFSARWASVWGASIAIAVVVGAITQYRSLARPGLQAMAANKFDLWVQSALFGVELVLAGAKYAWVVVVAFLKVQPNKNRDLRA